MRKARPIRNFADDEPGDTAMTLAELIYKTGESNRTLRDKLKDGEFPGAYQTKKGSGEWRIPLDALRKYRKARVITA